MNPAPRRARGAPYPDLAIGLVWRMLRGVKAKLLLPVILMIVFAVSRIPGLLPLNFSAAYALMFCAGVYFPRRLLWLPFATMFVTDCLLNWCYYHVGLGSDLIGNYLCYGAVVWLGRCFSPKTPFLGLLGGGLLGAVLFYLLTNTISWLQNPEYAKTLAGWINALTRGTSGHPETWTFFRNTLLSGGLFTGLFAAAMKLLAEPEPAEEPEPADDEPEKKPEEARA